VGRGERVGRGARVRNDQSNVYTYEEMNKNEKKLNCVIKRL
jgi:hypothetical protein